MVVFSDVDGICLYGCPGVGLNWLSATLLSVRRQLPYLWLQALTSHGVESLMRSVVQARSHFVALWWKAQMFLPMIFNQTFQQSDSLRSSRSRFDCYNLCWYLSAMFIYILNRLDSGFLLSKLNIDTWIDVNERLLRWNNMLSWGFEWKVADG